jgi:hypothetical protein
MEHAICKDCGGNYKQPEINYEHPQVDLLIYTHPTKYKHVCDKCGKIMYFNKIYPSVAYKECEE